ncbi:MAG: hypothetical protein IPG73_04505 [Ignavibacteria bacterium]|nr:hypothetical protein [Ignavibacteria bacterium]
MARRLMLVIMAWLALLGATISTAQPDAVLIERMSPAPAGFYRTNIYGSGEPTFLFSRFHFTSVVASSHPVVAPSIPAFVRIEETAGGAFIVVRDLTTGDSLRAHTVQRGSSNVHWNQLGNIVFETPPVDGVGALVTMDPTTGRFIDSSIVTRQYMNQSSPSQGACVVAPTSKRFAFIRVSTAEDGASNIPIPAYQDVGSPIARYPIPPYTTARVNGKEEKRVLVACGPSVPRPLRHLSWNDNATLIAFYGIVTYDRPYPTDTTRTYRVGSEGIFVVDIFSREVREIRTTKNVAAEHPDQFFFAPSGSMLAYTVRPDGGQPHVFISNAAVGGPGSDLGNGMFISSQTTDLVWHCSPWTRSGGRLIINRNDGSLITRPRCGSDMVMVDGTTQQQTFLSAQSADVDARSFTPSVMILDPWPDLINNAGEIRTDAWMMLPRTHQVRGCAADGASRLVLRIVVPSWMNDAVSVSLLPENCAEGAYGHPDRDGWLSAAGSEVSQARVSVKPIVENGVGICGVVYHAPEDCVADQSDTARTLRKIRLAVTARDVQSFIDIEIVRPPLILVHGIWSSPALFNNFAPITTASSSDPRFHITRLDFAGQSSKPVDDIIGRWGTGIPVRLESSIVNTYTDHVAVRGDVVGHSLGPVLMRYMAASRLPTVFTRRNGGAGHVHKLISLDSPHLGSPYCSILADAVVNNPVRAALLDKALAAFVVKGTIQDPASGGIVGDLRPTSSVITVSAFPDYLSLQPRLHTIASVVTTEQEEANDYLIDLIDVIGGLDLSSNTFSFVFNGAPNDLTVSENSQKAGLLFDHDPERTTLLRGVAHSDGFSETIGVCNSASGASQRVLQLLHAPSNGPEFSSKATTLPPGIRTSSTGDHDVSLGMQAILDPTPLIFINGPSPDATIVPGSTITVSVEPLDGVTLDRVILVYRGTVASDSLAPFTFDFGIPMSSALGPMDIVALGVVNNATSNDLSTSTMINIQGPASCSALYFSGDSVLTLDGIHSKQPLDLVARFHDGYERNVERDQNTVYISRDSSICIPEDGWVRMIGEGSTYIVAKRCGLADSLRIECTSADLPPVADAGADTLINAPGTIELNGSLSHDPERGPLDYRWWIHAKPPSGSSTIGDVTAKQTSIAIESDGLTVVGLDVADSTGKHDTAWRFIRVGSATSVNGLPSPSACFNVYPNPCTGILNIMGFDLENVTSVTITNLLGISQIFPVKNTTGTTLVVGLDTLTRGVYDVAISPTRHRLVTFIPE